MNYKSLIIPALMSCVIMSAQSSETWKLYTSKPCSWVHGYGYSPQNERFVIVQEDGFVRIGEEFIPIRELLEEKCKSLKKKRFFIQNVCKQKWIH